MPRDHVQQQAVSHQHVHWASTANRPDSLAWQQSSSLGHLQKAAHLCFRVCFVKLHDTFRLPLAHMGPSSWYVLDLSSLRVLSEHPSDAGKHPRLSDLHPHS